MENEFWWSWNNTAPDEAINAGIAPMLHPMIRSQDDDIDATADHMYNQCVTQLHKIRERIKTPKVCLMPHDLGGYPGRLEEPRTLFDKQMGTEQVIDNIGWWCDVMNAFISRWNHNAWWEDDAMENPPLEYVHIDWEGSWNFENERDWRCAMVAHTFMTMENPPLVSNWTQTRYLSCNNIVAYTLNRQYMLDKYAEVKDRHEPLAAWVCPASFRTRRTGTWCKKAQFKRVQELRENGVTHFIYWYGSDHPASDWESLLVAKSGVWKKDAAPSTKAEK